MCSGEQIDLFGEEIDLFGEEIDLFRGSSRFVHPRGRDHEKALTESPLSAMRSSGRNS
jgi:hypothetical protein